ncbi:MAG TPA: hypothetical protein VD863_20960, partial [Bradyrhizobium sp.]|nr:hypothetical protein [Bradyrhizobium sp.]
MSKKREHGDGGIDQRGSDTFRLRYRVRGRRFSVTFRGTRAEAKTELRRLVRTGDTGQHIAPDKMTLGEWIAHWLSIGAPGRRKKQVGRRTLERYAQLLNCHVVPTLATTRLQNLQASDIDSLYVGLDGKIAPRTQHHVHVVL